MTFTRKARYSNGILTPLEPLGLEEDAEIIISIAAPLDNPSEERVKTTKSAVGGWKGSQDPDELIRILYQYRLTGSGSASLDISSESKD